MTVSDGPVLEVSEPPADAPAVLSRRSWPEWIGWVLLTVVSAATMAEAIHYRFASTMADDGAFFARYAENMAHGHFWVWNVGEKPVWGASAPFYPALAALPVRLGLTPHAALIGVGLALGMLTFVGVTLGLAKHLNVAAGLAFTLFAALDTKTMYYLGAGLETPLTVALLALAVWTLVRPVPPWAAGLAAGALMVNKIDLVPVGLVLLGAYWLKDKHFPRRAVAVAAGVAVTWYVFAWVYFGAPVPNSFLTKSLHQNNMQSSLDWSWFSHLVFESPGRRLLVVLCLVALAQGLRTRSPLALFLTGLVVVHVVGYSVEYPFEPYDWYAEPTIFALLLGAGIGTGIIARLVWRLRMPWAVATTAVGVVLLGVAVHTTWPSVRSLSVALRGGTSVQEGDRADAGRWVAANTPKSDTVFTEWGNPAFYSQRRVIDGSFLNRKWESGDLIAKYKPEIVIFQGNPGSTPAAPVIAAGSTGYTVVKVFDKSFQVGFDYYFAVLARNDIAATLPNQDPVRHVQYDVAAVHRGAGGGELATAGSGALFVRPGATDPTSFTFDTNRYLAAYPAPEMTLNATIAQTASASVTAGGPGTVHLTVSAGTTALADVSVDAQHPLVLRVPKGTGPIRVTAARGSGTTGLTVSVR